MYSLRQSVSNGLLTIYATSSKYKGTGAGGDKKEFFNA